VLIIKHDNATPPLAVISLWIMSRFVPDEAHTRDTSRGRPSSIEKEISHVSTRDDLSDFFRIFRVSSFIYVGVATSRRSIPFIRYANSFNPRLNVLGYPCLPR
jgi:hypothetical protein